MNLLTTTYKDNTAGILSCFVPPSMGISLGLCEWREKWESHN